MSDLYSRTQNFKALLDSGFDIDTAQLEAGLSDVELISAGYMDATLDKEGDTLIPLAETAAEMEVRGDSYAGQDFNAYNAMESVREWTPDGTPQVILDAETAAQNSEHWWKSGLDIGGKVLSGGFRGVVQLASVPQQVITHLIAGETMRSAIPGYLRPDEWGKDDTEKTEYKYVSMLTALNELPVMDYFIGTHEELNEEFRDQPTFSQVPDAYMFPNGIRIPNPLSALHTLTMKGRHQLAFATTDLVVDIATDPMTYAVGYGLFGRAVNLFRRLGPMPQRAAALTRIAEKTKDIDDLLPARLIQDELETYVKKNLSKGKITKEEAEIALKKIDGTKKYLDNELDLRLDAKDGEILAHQVPTTRPETITIPKEGTASPERIAILTARKKALDADPTAVRAMYEGEGEALTRAVTGPDDAERAARNIEVLGKGGGADDVLHNTQMPINGTQTSTGLGPEVINGVGRDGRVLDVAANARKVIGQLQDVSDQHLDRLDRLRKGLKEVDTMVDIEMKGPLDGLAAHADELGLGRVEMQGQAGLLVRAEIVELEAKMATMKQSLKNLKLEGQGPILLKRPGQPLRKDVIAEMTEKITHYKARIKSAKAAHTEVTRTLGKDITAAAKANKAEVRAVKKAGKAKKKELTKGIDDQIDETTKALDDLQKHEKFVRDHGELAKGADKYDVRWPSGPRREITDAADFTTLQFGNGWHNFVARGLYPRSIVQRPNYLFMFDTVFRENWRVLDSYVPQIAKRIFGGMRDADTTYQRYSARMATILADAGVYTNVPKGGIMDTSGVGGIIKAASTDKQKATQIFQMLDTEAGTIARQGAEIGATKEMLRGAEELRVVYREFAETLGLSPDQKITDYVHHMINRNHMADGNIPTFLQGVSAKQGVPGILMTREGSAGVINTNIVSVSDYYLRAFTHETMIRPLGQEIRWGIQEAIRTAKDPAAAKWLKGYGEVTIARLNGKPSSARKLLQGFEAATGLSLRHVDKGVGAIGLAAYSSVLSGSTRYFVMSAAQAINSTVPSEGGLHTLRGIAQMTSPEGRAFARQVGAADDAARLFEGFDDVLSDAVSRFRLFGAPSIRTSETFIRGMTMHASLSKQLSKAGYKSMGEVPINQLNEMVAVAMRDTRSMNHVFGWLGKPAWFNQVSRSGSTAVTQFTSFPFKQTETIMHNSLKNPGYLVDYILYAGWMSGVADKAGVDLDKYIGLPEFKSLEDLETIPVKIAGALFKVVSTSFDGAALPTEKREAEEDFWKEAENLVPFLTAMKRWNTLREAASGQVSRREDNKGNLIRERDFSIDKKGWVGSDLVAALLHMPSVNDRIEAKQREEIRKHKSETDVRRMELADMFARNAQRGTPLDMPLVYELSKELAILGEPMSVDNLVKMSADATQAYEMPAVMRLLMNRASSVPVAAEAAKKEKVR